MSLILDALRKAKSLAGGSVPPKAPAYLKSFGFTEQAPQNKTRKILVTYVLPVVVLGSIIAAGIVYWVSRTASSPMQQQVALLDTAGELPEELVFDDPVTGDDPLAEQEEVPVDSGMESGEETEAESTEAPAEAPGAEQVAGQARESEPEAETTSPAQVPVSQPPGLEPESEPEESVTEDPVAAESANEDSPVPSEQLPPAETADIEAPHESPATGNPTTDPSPASDTVQIGPPAADPFRLGVFYQQRGDYPRALGYYQQILNANPLNAVVHNNIGLIHRAMSNNEEAIASFRSAIYVDESYDLAHNNLGITLMEEGQTAEATGEFRRALELNPRNTAAMTNLAILVKDAGEFEEAKFGFLRALQNDPSLVEAHYNLALIFEEQGENGSAIKHFQLFLELGSSLYPERVIEVEKKIQELSRKEP